MDEYEHEYGQQYEQDYEQGQDGQDYGQECEQGHHPGMGGMAQSWKLNVFNHGAILALMLQCGSNQKVALVISFLVN